MLGETVLLDVVSAIIACLVQGGSQGISKKVQQALKIDPENQAIKHALNDALEAIRRDYPDIESSFFDETFLKTQAAPVLARYLKYLRVSNVRARELARAYSSQFSIHSSTTSAERIVPIAKAFLSTFDEALRRQPVYREAFNSQALRGIERHSAHTAHESTRTANALEALLAAQTAGVARPVSGLLHSMDEEPMLYGPPVDVDALPLPSAFVDRETERAWVIEQLRSQNRARIAAVRGMPGVGKTAIIAECIQAMHSDGEFVDGIAVISCEGVNRPADLLRQVLARFDSRRRPPTEPDAQLGELAQSCLRDKDALIVLDSIEPQLDLREILSPLRRTGVAIAIVSTHMLGHEIVPQDATRQIKLLPEAYAQELLARAYGKTAFEDFSPQERRAARQIIQQLDRHTLALKLAGAYARDYHRPLATVARELENLQRALNLPDGEAERSVARIFRRSENSLSSGARQLFTSLALFAAPEFGRKAGLALADSIRVEDPDEALDQLTRRALLEPLEPLLNQSDLPQADSERLYFHPLLRALAVQNLGQWDPRRVEAAEEGLAQHYAATINESDFAAIQADDRNITQSFNQSLTRGNYQLAVQIGLRMRHYWHERRIRTEAEQLLAVAVSAAARVLEAHPLEDNARNLAELRVTHARILTDMGDFKGALLELEAVRKHPIWLTHPILQSKVMYDLALISWYQGQNDRGRKYAEESIEFARMSDQPDRAAYGLLFLAYLNATSGHLEDAVLLATEVSTIAYGAANPKFAPAAKLIQSLAASQNDTSTTDQPMEDVLREFVRLVSGRDVAQGVDLLTALQELSLEAQLRGDQIGEGLASVLTGVAAATQNQISEAKQFIESGQRIASDISMPLLEAGALLFQAVMADYEGRLDLAEAYYTHCLVLLDESETPLLQGYVCGYYGIFLINRRGDRDRGCHAIHDAISILENNGLPEHAGRISAEAERVGCSEVTRESDI